ncbi:MAG: LysM peptidoglycan-binding domain-containing protein [Caldilineaceae bacterium]
MNRRQLAFVVVLNALISVVVALAVVWAVEARRPDPETLLIDTMSGTQPIILPTTTPTNLDALSPSLPAATSETATGETGGETAAAPTATLDPTTQQIYTIQSGDSLSAVADRFGVTMADIVAANGLADPNFVYVGQRLIIPAQGASTNGSSAVSGTQQSSTTNPTLDSGQGILIRTVDAPGDALSEALQIVNDSNDVVNFSGWRLERENGPAYTFGPLSVFPGGSIWVHTTTGTDTSIALYWKQTEAVWQSGSTARLVDGQGNVIYRYTVP